MDAISVANLVAKATRLSPDKASQLIAEIEGEFQSAPLFSIQTSQDVDALIVQPAPSQYRTRRVA